jgi:ferredoxin
MKIAAFPPEVAPERCSGCGRCVAACPARLFTLETAGYRKYAVRLSPERCSNCLRCVEACPVGALVRMER